ncbi:unnamed protein product, partial [Symbiodinium necroappetens]
KMGVRSVTPIRKGGAPGSSGDGDYSTSFGDGHDTTEAIEEETLNVVPGIDDNPDDATSWAAGLSFPDMMDLARAIKRDLNDAGHEDKKRDGWKGPIGLGSGGGRAAMGSRSRSRVIDHC